MNLCPPSPAPRREPLENILWKHVDELKANGYNPNVVFSPELRLLERSILATGWVQPILITPKGTIIDGFHRWSLSRESKDMQRRWGGLVPCAVVDVAEWEAMLLTIRMNRAKGSHVAFRMASIIQALVNVHGIAPEQVALEMGAGRDEVDLLLQEGVFEAKDIANYKYSKAWYPKETTHGG